MALGRNSIANARTINGEVSKMGQDMQRCFNEMMSACSSNPTFQAFVSETDIGLALSNKLNKVTEAMYATGNQMIKVANATNEFLNVQERINAGR